MQLRTRHYVIIALLLLTAFLHFGAANDARLFEPGTALPDPLFTLNGLGYLGLLLAYFLPLGFLQQRHRLVWWTCLVYIIVTIVAWLVIWVGMNVLLGGKPFFDLDSLYGVPVEDRGSHLAVPTLARKALAHPATGGTMERKSLFFLAPRQLELREEAMPELRDAELLVKTELSAISAGTEMLVYRGELPAAAESQGDKISSHLAAILCPTATPPSAASWQTGPSAEPSWRDGWCSVFSHIPRISSSVLKKSSECPMGSRRRTPFSCPTWKRR